MLKQLRNEFYRVFKSKTLVILSIILIALTIFVNSWIIPGYHTGYGPNGSGGFYNTWDKNTYYHELTDQSVFVYDYEIFVKYNGIDALKERNGYGDHPAETLEELFFVTVPGQFVRIMWYSGGFSVMMLLLPMFLFTRDKRNDLIYIRGRLCGSFKRVALAKIIVYYIIVALTSIISPFILIAANIPQAWSMLGAGYMLRCIVLHVFMDMAVMSLPVLVAFAIDSPALCTIASFLLALASIAANVLAARCSDILYIPFLPSVLQGMRALWQPDTPTGAIVFAFACSVVFIVVCTALSCALFNRKGKKFFDVK